tara:strand:- start:120 stop:521 length:402 start_codon:yes stop_codon:yes gene_type:complete
MCVVQRHGVIEIMEQTSFQINYILRVLWPSHCRNRDHNVLKERPDIVKEMNGMRGKIENFLKVSCGGRYKISDEYNMQGFNIGLESGPDVYNFILEQATIGYEIEREMGRYNIFSDKYIKHRILYTAKGVVVD